MNSIVFKRFIKRKTSLIGGIILLIFFGMAIFGPLIVRYDPNAIDLRNAYQAPNKHHPLGTDNLGRDIFTRIVIGARTSLLVSLVGTFYRYDAWCYSWILRR